MSQKKNAYQDRLRLYGHRTTLTKIDCLHSNLNAKDRPDSLPNFSMCGRFRLTRVDKLAGRFDIAPEDDWVPRYNVAPAQSIPVIRQPPEQPKRFGSKRW